jgi:hypothetical protein
VSLDGAFSPGDYWQYEARADVSNDNGPFQTSPHGPERDFGPLALMRYAAVNAPLVLERWLDDRYPPLCELTADDIAFDGDHIGSDSDTVQEIIEELWEKVGGGCCEFTLEPPQGDAAIPIRDILQATQGEVTICFEPGIYDFTSTLDIDNRTVILKGCPRAVFVAGGIDPLLHVGSAGQLVLEHLVLLGRQADDTRVLIDLDADCAGLDARDVGLFDVPDPNAAPASIAIRVGDAEPPPFNPDLSNPPLLDAPDGRGPALHLQRVTASASWAIAAANLRALEIVDSVLECARGGVWAARVTQLDARSTRLVAGVSLAALQAWTPDALLTSRDTLVAPLGDLEVPGGSPAANSIAVWAGALTVGTVSHCQLTGGVGFAATFAVSLDLHHNQHNVTHTGVHLVAADGCTISGETVQSVEGAFGVIARTASSVSITDCELRRFRTGVSLGGTSDANELNFFDVQVHGNRILEVQTGIQVGPNATTVYTGQLSQVAITENTISARTGGVVVNALSIGSQNLGTLVLRPVAVRVADNLITSRSGIGIFGRDVEVANNMVRPIGSGAGGGSTFFGIIGVNTSNLICEGNHVEVSVPQEIDLPLTANLGSQPGFMAAVVGANVQPAAIVLAGGAGATVANNVTHADANIAIRSLAADDHTQLSVKGNDFMCGPAMCTNTDEIVFLDNTVLGRVLITGSSSGQLADNRVRVSDALKLEGDLEILLATGRWKVADNRADGAIRIIPTSTGGWQPPWFLGAGSLTLSRWTALDTLGRLSNNSRFMEAISQPAADAAPAPVAGESAPAARESSTASYAMANRNWREDYRHAISDFVAVGGDNTLIDILRPAEIIVVGALRESAYQLLCTANWAEVLEVGIANIRVRPSTQSTVQVVANRADEVMFVKRYINLVMAMNVAGQYTAAGNPTQQSIEQFNLEI